MLFKTKNNNLHRMTLCTVTKMPPVLSRAVPTFYNVTVINSSRPSYSWTMS